jgi:hypothetical protein
MLRGVCLRFWYLLFKRLVPHFESTTFKSG